MGSTGVLYRSGQIMTEILADSVQPSPLSRTVGFNGALNAFIKCISGVYPITLTLETAVGFGGQRITIFQAGTGTVTLKFFEKETCNGATSKVLSNLNQCLTLESDGANWLIVGTAG